MTHVELIEKLEERTKNNFEEQFDTTLKPKEYNDGFKTGMLFAYSELLLILKGGLDFDYF